MTFKWRRWRERAAAEADMLPEGVNETADGKYEMQCCSCERWTPIYCDVSEIPVTGYQHYCGGSPWCMP